MDDIQKSIYYTVAQICTQESETTHFEITDDAIATMCEVVLGYSESLSNDLEAFAAHGKRTTVNPSDVRLVARKQPYIQTKLDEKVIALEEGKKKRRKKNDGTLSS